MHCFVKSPYELTIAQSWIWNSCPQSLKQHINVGLAPHLAQQPRGGGGGYKDSRHCLYVARVGRINAPPLVAEVSGSLEAFVRDDGAIAPLKDQQFVLILSL